MSNFRSGLVFVLCLTCGRALGQDTKYSPEGEQIPGPSHQTGANSDGLPMCCAKGGQEPVSQAAFDTWLADIRNWRAEHSVRIGYDGSQYDRPELKWTQSSFIQPQMMAQDRYFYDPKLRQYTVGRYLTDLKKRYGGIDSVLIWPTYPNLGIDSRNQFDLIRDMPGGTEGLRAMVEAFHRSGVRVLWPYNPWDRGTRPEGAPDWETIAKLAVATGSDGINGDTMSEVPPVFRKASDQTGHPIALEPEGGDSGESDAAVAWNNLTWGYWKYPFEPMISKNKWIEPRHMVNVSNRWARDKIDDLQYAFFNGVGYVSWEGIWGIWNQLDDRDAEALRRIATVERAMAAVLVSPGWEPHTPVLQFGAYASKFPGEGRTLWTFVNRNEYALAGRQIRVASEPGWHYYDLWHGAEIQPEMAGSEATLSFEMEPHGYGAILATAELSSSEKQLLEEMRGLSSRPLESFSHEWHFLPQQIVDIAPTRPAGSPPEGMVTIPEGDFTFAVSGIEIEGGNWIGLDVQMPWENSPRRDHLHKMHIKSFYLDRAPVTNAEFKKFLDASHYHPKDDHNFLRDWQDGAPGARASRPPEVPGTPGTQGTELESGRDARAPRTFPEGWANKPVTWVSLEDARAYAAWAGKRLPHEWEWQYAAQGADGRLYPWGNDWDASAVPPPDKGRALTAPPNVGGYPKGASPFGVLDMVGTVWQWTDEYVDDHTRAAILRGGSYYQPQGSLWYFPQAYKLNEHGKYLLMAPSIDRSGTVGFRCAVDKP
ncbi:MAG TPA: SUMF1/EgtB/PvdO family nonheme iron enzyme [Terriglobia bacterium]|nr:SUMF1/EgtB/PvdO family nonheme iron enzyme [Terriglobia bacterium]